MHAEAILQKLVIIILLISTPTHQLQLGPNLWGFGPVLTGVRHGKEEEKKTVPLTEQKKPDNSKVIMVHSHLMLSHC
jgi:hypothetical protein